MTKLKKDLENALVELRKGKERKFDQTVDLIINLQKFDVKKSSINLFVSVPHKIKDKKVCGFLESKNQDIKTITPEEFKKYSDKKELKKLVKNFDFFIAQGSVMPKVATFFGRVLGPAGKMPSPQAGIITQETDEAISGILDKMKKSVRIRTKEKSIKLKIGKEDMSDSDLKENIEATLEAIEKTLPRGKESMKDALVKLTMSKPIKIMDNRRK